MKELKLDLTDCMEIVTHPMHLPLIYASLKKMQTALENEGLFFPRIPPITSSLKLDPNRPTGDWTRTNVLPDTKYVTWVEDIKSPSSWAIYFGLVETEQEPNIFLMKTPVIPIAFDEKQRAANQDTKQRMRDRMRQMLDANPITPWYNPSVFIGVTV